MKNNRKHNFDKKLHTARRNWVLYLFLLPAMLYFVFFNYAPIYGLQIAFKNYSIARGVFGSEWVGFKWFEKFFTSTRFSLLLKNTLGLSIYSILVGFPLPVLFAFVLNDIKNLRFKKFCQTVTYLPHFISTVILVGMISVFFSPRSGFVNTIIKALGGEGGIYFLGIPSYFPHIYVWSEVWQSLGWSSIIYMAALSGVDSSLHEAAMIDGANRVKRIIHIDFPSIMPTMSVMLILRLGSVMNVGYEKVFLLQNSLNINVSEVIATYVYKVGILQQQFSYSTAIGLFNNIINFTLLIFVNKVVGRLSGSKLW